MALPLYQVHAVQAEILDFHNGLRFPRSGFWSVWVDEEASSWASSIADI